MIGLVLAPVLPFLILWASIPPLVGDSLALQSGPLAQVRFFLCMAALSSAPVSAILALVWLGSGKERRKLFEGGEGRVVQAAFAFAFIAYVWGSIFPHPGWRVAFLGLGLALASVFTSYRFGKAGGKQEKLLSSLSRGTALASILALGAAGYSRFSAPAPHSPVAPQGVLLLVMDGLSPDDLSSYNPSKETPAFDRLSRRGLLFERMRTCYTATYHYFSILYSGRKDEKFTAGGLLGRLEDGGVKTRWISYHNNGVPRGRAGGAGLRGGWLSQNTSWLPAAMRLDYGVFWFIRPGYRGRSQGPMSEKFFEALNHRSQPRDFFSDFLPSQVEELGRGGRPFFLVAHSNVPGLGEAPQGRWEEGLGQGELDKAKDEMQKADDAYDARHERFLGALRAGRARLVERGLDGLESFWNLCETKGWDKNMLLIVTADHGYMVYKRGKAWYGFHPDEEVARVPLLVLGRGLRGHDGANRETTDIPETVLRHFGLKAGLFPGAVSLFDPVPEGRVVTTLTDYSKVRDERFLVANRGDKKFLFNLAKKDPPRVFSIRGLESNPEPGRGIGPRAAAIPLPDILRDYGLESR